MAKRVFITGLGIISSIGDNVSENLQSLQSGRSGIGEIELLETAYRGVLKAGEIKHTDAELAAMAGVEPAAGLTRTALLGMIAAGEAIGSSQFAVRSSQSAVISQRSIFEKKRQIQDVDSNPATRNPEPGTWNRELRTANCEQRTGILSGCTVGGMVATEKYYPDYLAGELHKEWIEANECSESTERIANYLGISDYISTINTACSSSANAIMMAAKLIRAGMLDRAVAGGTDALSMFTVNGFNTLMIYDKGLCKPFDDRRFGMNLGEGAAYLVLESEEALGDRTPLCELTGYGNSTDAFHQTAQSPEGTGAYQAMKEALDCSGLQPSEIGYINAHGTATMNNDLSEGIAIQRLFGKKTPPLSSTKANTGHLLGASGAAEAAYSVLSLIYDTAWPNLNFEVRMKELSFSPLTRALKGSGIRNVLSNSFGFGGNNTTLIFSKTTP